ncbi:MAG TPA: TIGR03435 family protein [Bryobacteraceae bacterium]|nr:TIGR03435 family protein [Bryobacteraceae bacterium]
MIVRVAAALVCAASGVVAQSAARFEVVSIRPHVMDPSNDSSNTDVKPGGRLVCRNVSVKKLIRMAFITDDAQILNAPGWTETASYDIDAKTAGGVEVNEKNISGLLLSLLESRFQFRFHREQREKAIYRLEAAKDGVKLKEDAEEARPATTVNSNGMTVTFSAKRISMKDFAATMQRQVGRTIEDHTELTGKYDVNLKWSTERAGIDTAGPSVFTALQEVGLRLVPAKGPVEMVVVDGVERASEN